MTGEVVINVTIVENPISDNSNAIGEGNIRSLLLQTVNTTNSPLYVNYRAGDVFTPSNPYEQDMVLGCDFLVEVPPNSTVENKVVAYCGCFNLDIPSTTTTFYYVGCNSELRQLILDNAPSTCEYSQDLQNIIWSSGPGCNRPKQKQREEISPEKKLLLKK